MTRRSIWTWAVLPTLFFGVAAVVMTFPVAFHLTDAVLHPADPLLNAWILAWDAHILPRDPLALYQANHFYPYSNTLAYSETLLGQGLFAIPIIWLTHNPILAVNIAWLTSFILSGVGMHALVYHFTRQRGAALVAGMIFAFHPFRFAHILHVQILSTQWTPLAFLFLDRLIKRRRWSDAAWGVLFFNLQVLSCYYYALFIAVATAVLLVGYWLLGHRRFDRRLLLLLAVWLVLTAAVQIPLSIPYFTVSQSMEFERSVEDAVRGGADLTDFVTAPPASWLYGPSSSRLHGEGWWEHVTFPGMTAIVLGVAGAVWGLKRKNSWREPAVLYLILAITMAMLSLGPALRLEERTVFSPLPYRFLFDYVPGFQAIRQPARFHVFTMAGLSVLAGIGVATLVARRPRPWWTRTAALFLIGAITLENATMPLPFTRVPLADYIPPVYRWLAAQPDDGPVLELPILMDVGATESPRLYYSTFHWKRMVNGYGGFFPPTYAYFLFFDREFPDQPYRWIVGLGVRYVVLHRWQYDVQELQRIDARLAEFGDRLQLAAEFGDDQVFQVIQPATGLPNHPLSDRSLGGKAVLLGYFFNPHIARPGDMVEISLFWQDRAPMSTDYTVFVHVVDGTGAPVTQHDGQPVNGERPTSTWRRDEVVVDVHAVPIPENMPPGTYEVRVGMYELQTMERLPVWGIDGMIPAGFLTLGRLRVVAN